MTKNKLTTLIMLLVISAIIMMYVQTNYPEFFTTLSNFFVIFTFLGMISLILLGRKVNP